MTQKFHIFDGFKDLGWVVIGDNEVKNACEALRYMKGWLEESVQEYSKTCNWKLMAMEPPKEDEGPCRL